MGAGIGLEFGHSFDGVMNVWAVWHWADESENDFVEGLYDVYVIQGTEDEEGIRTEYCFSDTLDLVYNGVSEMASIAIASASVLYALIWSLLTDFQNFHLKGFFANYVYVWF